MFWALRKLIFRWPFPWVQPLQCPSFLEGFPMASLKVSFRVGRVEGYRSPTCRLSNTYQRNVSGTVAACVGGSEGCPTFPAEQSCFGAFLAETAWFQSLDGCLSRSQTWASRISLANRKSTPVFVGGAHASFASPCCLAICKASAAIHWHRPGCIETQKIENEQRSGCIITVL